MRGFRGRTSGTPRRRLAAVAAAVAAAVSMGAGAAVTLPAFAAGSNPTYTPQGGAWPTIDGVGLYRPGMTMTVPKRHGLRVFQELLNEHGADLPITGTYGELTETAVRDFQRANRLPVTGSINLLTSRYLLGETIRREAAAAGVPVDLLCGHVMTESTMDPGAVGGTGTDLGVAQIVKRYVPELTEAQIWDEDAAIRYMARRDAKAYRMYGRWDIAVTSYNSPLRALNWSKGNPVPLAKSYAAKVMAKKCTPPKAVSTTIKRGERASRSAARTGSPTAEATLVTERDGGYCLVGRRDARWRAFVRRFSAAEQTAAEKAVADKAGKDVSGLLLPGYVVQLRPDGSIELTPTPMSPHKGSPASSAPDALCA